LIYLTIQIKPAAWHGHKPYCCYDLYALRRTNVAASKAQRPA